VPGHPDACRTPVSTPPEPAPCPQGWSHTAVPGKCCPPRTSWDGKRCQRGAPPLEETCPPNSDSAYTYPDCGCDGGMMTRRSIGVAL
jgi:hypothetical protein